MAIYAASLFFFVGKSSSVKLRLVLGARCADVYSAAPPSAGFQAPSARALPESAGGFCAAQGDMQRGLYQTKLPPQFDRYSGLPVRPNRRLGFRGLGGGKIGTQCY